jgi:hypothetical protein
LPLWFTVAYWEPEVSVQEDAVTALPLNIHLHWMTMPSVGSSTGSSQMIYGKYSSCSCAILLVFAVNVLDWQSNFA